MALLVASIAWQEAEHEIPKRQERFAVKWGLGEHARDLMHEQIWSTARSAIEVVPLSLYGHLEEEAKRRIPRDHRDWPTVALALAFRIPIWTKDNDYLGCGLAVWTSDTLLAVKPWEQSRS